MSLNVKVIKLLDEIAFKEVGSNLKDDKALEYINKIQLPHSQSYFRTVYMKYYFKVKQDYNTLKYGLD